MVKTANHDGEGSLNGEQPRPFEIRSEKDERERERENEQTKVEEF
jgi:hypothetical protein